MFMLFNFIVYEFWILRIKIFINDSMIIYFNKSIFYWVLWWNRMNYMELVLNRYIIWVKVYLLEVILFV